MRTGVWCNRCNRQCIISKQMCQRHLSHSVTCMASSPSIQGALDPRLAPHTGLSHNFPVLHPCVVCRYLADIVAELRHPRVSKEGTQTRLLFKKRMFRYAGIEAGLMLVLLLPLFVSSWRVRRALAWVASIASTIISSKTGPLTIACCCCLHCCTQGD